MRLDRPPDDLDAALHSPCDAAQPGRSARDARGSACARRPPAGRRCRPRRRDLGRSAAGVEPGGRPAARRRRLPGVGGRRRRRRSASPPSSGCASRSMPAATTRARSTGAGTPSSSRRSGCAGSRSTRWPDARGSRPASSAKPLAVAAGEHGLAYLAGTSPDVGVLGYALGGGISWMVRGARAGLQHDRRGRGGDRGRAPRPNRPRHRARPVLGDPRRRRQRRRGDGAGARAGPRRRDLRRRPVLADRARGGDPGRLARLDRGVPDTCESLGRMLQLPDAPFLPDHLRGRSFVLVEAAIIGSEADGAALVQPLRDLGPEIDTVAMMPTSDLSLVNMDPDFPSPMPAMGSCSTTCRRRRSTRSSRGSSGRRCSTSRSATSAARPRSGRPITGSSTRSSSRSSRSRSGWRRTRARSRPWSATVGDVLGALGPWDSGRRYLNFAESTRGPAVDLPGGDVRAAPAGQGGGTTRPACSSPTTRSRTTGATVAGCPGPCGEPAAR